MKNVVILKRQNADNINETATPCLDQGVTAL